MKKIYIGQLEAEKIAMDRGIIELPIEGREWLTVYAIATGKPCEVLGKDGAGYYLREYEGDE